MRMALQFVLGDLSVNKKRAIVERLLQIKDENPNAQIYYLVPEHLKFDMESYVLETIQDIQRTSHSAMFGIQVTSFSRLAWFMLPASLLEQTHLSKIGLTMLVRQLLNGLQAKLIVYRGQIHYQGFVEKLVTLFEELYEGNITSDDLRQLNKNSKHIVDREEQSEQLSLFEFIADETEREPFSLSATELQRIEELAEIYDAFCKAIEDYSLANYQVYHQLQDYLIAAGDLSNHYLVIDHHYYFNAHQLGLVMTMSRSFEQVWLTLPITQQEVLQHNWNPLVETPRQTYHQIRQLCQFMKVEVQDNWEIQGANQVFNNSVLEVARHFKEYYQYTMPSYNGGTITNNSHFMWRCDTPQTELRHVSNQIHYLVTQRGYRYRDILVVTRDMSRYQNMVEPIFDSNDIPLFFDHETKMTQHPFLIWLESCLNLNLYNWRYVDVIGVLKSILFRLNTELGDEEYWHRINHFENILLANGYFHYRLTNLDFEWHFAQEDTPYLSKNSTALPETVGEIVKGMRQQFVDTLKPWLGQWQTQKMTGTKAAEWLYHLVEQTGVQAQLENLRDAAIESGQLDESRRHEQVWQVFRNTLDEFYTIYAEHEIDYATFCEMILTGLKEGAYHIIPPTLDQVTFTNMESPQVHPYKICFIVGADEFAIPKEVDFQSLLSLENRSLMKEQLLPHQFLSDRAEQHANQEALLTYQLLLNATEQLYVSYAVNVGARTVKLAPAFQQLVQAFQWEVTVHAEQTGNTDELMTLSSSFGKFRMQLSPVLRMIRDAYETQCSLSPNLIGLIELLEHDAVTQLGESVWQFIKRVFNFSNLPINLNPSTALQLFGKNIHASVSKIEQYYQDPYSHFLLYGLKIRERDLFEVSAAKTGDYFHAFLEQFINQLLKAGKQLVNATPEQLMTIFQKVQAQFVQDYQYNLFQSHPRMKAIKYQMDRRLMQFIDFTRRQQQAVSTHIVQTEALFGPYQDAALEGFVYPLSSGGKLAIRGKIDRIDYVGSQQLVQVIDYKSGNKSFDIVDTYYGLDLQVLTYLSVAMKQYKDKQPLGAFYQPLIHGYQEGNQETWQMPNSSSLYDNRLKGVLSIPPSKLVEIEPQIENAKRSEVYPATLKQDGYSANSSYYDEQALSTLLTYTHWLFRQAAEQMQSGVIALQPFKQERYTPALRPQFRVITGFDATENYQAYRHKTIRKKDVLNQMQQILSDKEVQQHEYH